MNYVPLHSIQDYESRLRQLHSRMSINLSIGDELQKVNPESLRIPGHMVYGDKWDNVFVREFTLAETLKMKGVYSFKGIPLVLNSASSKGKEQHNKRKRDLIELATDKKPYVVKIRAQQGTEYPGIFRTEGYQRKIIYRPNIDYFALAAELYECYGRIDASKTPMAESLQVVVDRIDNALQKFRINRLTVEQINDEFGLPHVSNSNLKGYIFEKAIRLAIVNGGISGIMPSAFQKGEIGIFTYDTVNGSFTIKERLNQKESPIAQVDTLLQVVHQGRMYHLIVEAEFGENNPLVKKNAFEKIVGVERISGLESRMLRVIATERGKRTPPIRNPHVMELYVPKPEDMDKIVNFARTTFLAA